MDNLLIAEKERKEFELSAKKAELDQLKIELSRSKDKEYQVELIEKLLADKHRRNQEEFQFDKAAEEEMLDMLSDKEHNYESLVNLYKYMIDFDLHHLGNKAASEERKTAINKIKQLLGELDLETKGYYKKHISSNVLIASADLMDRICDKTTVFGSLPVSFKNKAYSWRLKAKDLPVDEELQDREKETSAKKKVLAKLSDLEESEKKTAKDIKKGESNILKKEKKLLAIQTEVSTEEIEEKKKSIIQDSLEEKIKLEQKYNKKIQKCREAGEKKIELNTQQTEAFNKRLAANQDKGKELEKERERLEEELDNTFGFLFSKKRELSERIAGVNKEKTHTDQIANQILLELKKLESQDPKREMEESLKEIQDRLQEEMEDIDDDVQEEFKRLEKEISLKQKKIQEDVNLLNKEKQELNALKAVYESQKKEKAEYKAVSDNFHSYYLLNTVSKELSLSSFIAERRKKKGQLSTDIQVLKQEINELNKRIKAAVAEETKRNKAEKRERAEQEKRQKRVQKELADREKEQAILSDKDILNNLALYASKICHSPDHMFLEEVRCPFADDGNRLITNSIVRKQFVQRVVLPQYNKYVLVFTDRSGDLISDQRLIAQKTLGEKISISFELKAADGFSKDDYYLWFLDFDTGEVICVQKYKINISFANDFGF